MVRFICVGSQLQRQLACNMGTSAAMAVTWWSQMNDTAFVCSRALKVVLQSYNAWFSFARCMAMLHCRCTLSSFGMLLSSPMLHQLLSIFYDAMTSVIIITFVALYGGVCFQVHIVFRVAVHAEDEVHTQDLSFLHFYDAPKAINPSSNLGLRHLVWDQVCQKATGRKTKMQPYYTVVEVETLRQLVSIKPLVA